MKKVVVIGGGTGTFVMLTALRDFPIELSAIISMADDGGSTGRLRDQYGVLPPGDVRRALVALSDAPQTLRKLFNYRFSVGDLRGHNFGNIFLTVMEKTTGHFADAVKAASKILNIRGKVIPVTLDNTTLYAQLASGAVVRGETNIDTPKHNPAIPIEKVWLKPPAVINHEARKAILAADMVIIGPGDLFSSIIPNLLVKGVAAAIKKSRAKKVYICNLMTKFGETHGFKAHDFVNTIEKYLGNGILDFAVFNNKKPPADVLRKYQKENSHFVDITDLDKKRAKPRLIFADLLDPALEKRKPFGQSKSALFKGGVDPGPFIRHNPKKKLAKVLISLLRG